MATLVSPFRPLGLAAGLAVAAAALASPSPASPDACPPIDPPAAAPARAGVRAFIDPVTGKIRPPTPEERRKIAASTRAPRDRSGRTYEIQIRPDGTRIVELDDAFLMSVVATANPDGTISYRCRTGPPPAGGPAAEPGK